VGPTASGKSALALRLASALRAEIVCCDALQIRQGLPLLTAKQSDAERALVPHHLIDVLPLFQPATAAVYASLADEAIAQIRARGRRVVLCGGTGLYLRALLRGLFRGPGADARLRQELRAEAGERGVAALHARLREVDPEAAARISQRDYMRIERALEVFLSTGRPISAWQAESRTQAPRYQAVCIGIDPGQEALRQRIRARVVSMVDQGVVHEVAQAHAECGQLLHLYPPLGYRTVLRHIHGELGMAEMCEALVRETARYARRQRTWFRGEEGVRWYLSGDAVPLDEAELTGTDLTA
jgi:tRNA dimethylallyltransferase